MPKLNNFFDKTETVEKILTKKMHPQLVSIKNLEESKLQYRDCLLYTSDAADD